MIAFSSMSGRMTYVLLLKQWRHPCLRDYLPLTRLPIPSPIIQFSYMSCTIPRTVVGNSCDMQGEVGFHPLYNPKIVPTIMEPMIGLEPTTY